MEEQKALIKRLREKYNSSIKPGVSIILPTNKPDCLDNIFNTYERLNYSPKELIIILNNDSMDINNYISKAVSYKDVKIFKLDERVTLGECLNHAIENSKYDFIAKMDDDDYYGENYLLDEMNVFNYTDADVTGKSKRFIYFEDNNALYIMHGRGENTYVAGTAGGTILAKKSVFDKIKFHNVNCAEDEAFFDDCSKNGFKVYSNNRYNYVYIRHSDLDSHTWKISAERLENISTKIGTLKDFKEIVSV